ncbi:MAG: hypothetical protein ACOX8W_02925 [bacterium]|jgi:hypothetical protein
MAYPKFNRTRGLRALRIASFAGYSLAEDPDSLPSGYLVEGSRNIDLSRVLGALAKRRGVERQVGSIGEGGVKGIHTYRSAGERILLGHGTSLYRLTGEALDIAGDFAAGTFRRVIAQEGKLVLAKDPLSDEETTTQNGEGTSYQAGTAFGQTFTTGATAYRLTGIRVRIKNTAATRPFTLTVYSDISKAVMLGTDTLNVPTTTYAFKFEFEPSIPVTPDTQYYFEVTADEPAELRQGTPYAGGDGYVDGTLANDHFFIAYVESPYYNAGDWLSPEYDLGTTPAVSVIEWRETLPPGTTVQVKARGSNDGQTWGEWQAAESPGALPRTRYLQLQVFLTGGANTPEVWDIAVDYETSFTDYEEIKAGLSGNKLRFVDYDNDCYFTDGGRPQRYDGSSFYNVGIDPPQTAPALSEGDAGDLTGTYKARVTFVNEWGAESNASPASGEITLSSDKIDWSDIPVGTAGQGIVARKLYRTKDGGEEYFFVTTIDNNTATTYSGDNVADANLITPMPTDNGIPPDAAIVYEHKDYLCYVASGDPSRLYFSKPGRPDAVPANNYKQFPGPVLALRTYQDALVVGGERFTAAVYGDIWGGSLDNTKVRVISEDAGPVSHEAMRPVFTPQGDILVFPSREQILYLSPGLQENSLRSIPLSDAVAPIFREAVNRQNMAAVYYGHKLYIALNYFGEDLPVETNNIIMTYDGRTGMWNPPWTIAAGGFAVCYGRLYCGSPTAGVVSELEKGTSDDGESIHAVAVLKPEYTELGPQAKKKFRQLRLAVTPDDAAGSLILRPAVDGVSAEIAPGPVDTWGGALVSPRLKLPLPRGHQFSLTIEDDSTDDWTISEIVTEYERGD